MQHEILTGIIWSENEVYIYTLKMTVYVITGDDEPLDFGRKNHADDIANLTVINRPCEPNG